MSHRHRPALTAARLAEIWDAEPGPLVLELLWEIHRLRSTISRANQVRHFLSPHGGAIPHSVWECFNRELDAEPCLSDPATPRQQALLDSLMDSAAQK
ncbi:conserved hypothetical protein [Paraburkholderia tropica]|uniref:hypothetical protein n=1 Tax=Paraburkholderia tropica TaxID=92647 RepID=UPI001CB2CE25|nr:hypothetical protein [Paraburkholderia tropica]CAG9235774.1 conserved hypothetical protein [Paraburkholderia tropica]